ncbi:hypothetical protein A2767_03150 [Candidatus Roizmanbacteria bacterium RIFCSPHIGHO2_01_FULL_35_10]|uniref:Uncharacterized protein n=1 Tax=Candidatus Roizmanbacteria bacterium RIFCSPLOWO2_01_FULL_35_13 TaxID=1802055 RepID=A0A1F7IFE2_9BACT|nr:MAG: hypothetical protein A2767_03150 [Candidatus Roizmanbacteria bacterium RIFCSPHIGHO2_01_FULL_35_10]OGK42088.1 MAG: hypothetical protein A3A74_04940 [Candidatus Roizmanbacteria bacterium RIFCSPLOWO2_01_FULL_35_13]
MENKDENIKIKIFLPKKVSKLLASASVSINSEYGFITIKGFQIWPSSHFNQRLQTSVNITPPSKQLYGRYTPFIFFEDVKSWYKLEELIFSAYQKFKDKKEKIIISEDVNPEDIPF